MAHLAAGDTTLTSADSRLAPLLRDPMEGLLGGEAQVYVAQTRPNRRNGHTAKVVKTLLGPLPIRVPRDWQAAFYADVLSAQRVVLIAVQKKTTPSEPPTIWVHELTPEQLATGREKYYQLLSEAGSQPLLAPQ